MGTMAVVVLDVAVEDAKEVTAAGDQEVVQALLATVPTQRSATALALGAWIGVRMTWAPTPRQTSSKARVNLLSRSWIRNRTAVASSSRVARRLRACWATHGPVGLAVTPAGGLVGCAAG